MYSVPCNVLSRIYPDNHDPGGIGTACSDDCHPGG